VQREPAEADQRLRTPCAHRLGERTENRGHGRVMSSRDRARQPPDGRAHGYETRDPESVGGFSDHSPVSPHAFHEFDEPGQLPADSEGKWPSGSHWAFARCSPDTLLRGERRSTPSRAGNLHRRSTLRLVSPRGSTCAHRQDASNPFLQPTFAKRAPAKAPLLETSSLAVGKPAGARDEDLANAAFPPDVRERRRTTFRSSSLQRPRA
jgi:hypothetical protein